ncbi:MAG: 1,4-alpha-glucan branching protein GlgB [Anaerolineaceae bacterium]|nr:MAG: 1,4-alpha-glucan branching protein GlgB [Anaerolineaceae bacterium]
MSQSTLMDLKPSDYQIYLFHEGTNYAAYQMLGSIYIHENELHSEGFCFRVWAPYAKDVSLVGDFNLWRIGEHKLHRIEDTGIWMIFVPGMKIGERYKYAITMTDGNTCLKADPFAYFAEQRPNTASVTYRLDRYNWRNPINKSIYKQPYTSPILIYEVHAGSWRRHEDGSFFSYRDLARELIPYALDMGYTHIELMPLQEYPYDGSWGYQVTGYYAATSRYGNPEDLMFFIDSCHEVGLKVIMDWVPAHFPKDTHGLAQFDGTYLYEYEDKRIGEHYGWGTLVFDFGKPEVHSFLISNALFWLEVYHFDGLRVDAVSSMIYRDYCREDGKWLPNIHGGRENLEAISFLQKLNIAVFKRFPHALMIAEESTAFPLVTAPVHQGGLGFNYKWNMGWMHDSLRYFSMDPIHRKNNHNLLTFLIMYTYSENFILPLSHDEVVHGKKSLLDKMFGKYEEKFATLRAFYGLMMALPGKKLLFMGGEFGQFIEWKYDSGLDWILLEYDSHRSLFQYVKALNHIYQENHCLWQLDHNQEGFKWIEADDTDNSVIAFLRQGKQIDEFMILVFNFTPIYQDKYRIAVPTAGEYYQLINSDYKEYGGETKDLPLYASVIENVKGNNEHAIYIELAPLSAVYLRKA